MAKRFPIPEFDHDELRALPWAPPAPLDPAEAQARIEAGELGAWPVAADPVFFEAAGIHGEHRHAVVCAVPRDALLIGRSYAWRIQYVAAFEGLPGAAAGPCLEWATPRPMNTRLGPQDGVPVPARVLTLVCGHRHAERWIGNRPAVDAAWRPAGASGLRVGWADDAECNDFHCAVAAFTWGA